MDRVDHMDKIDVELLNLTDKHRYSLNHPFNKIPRFFEKWILLRTRLWRTRGRRLFVFRRDIPGFGKILLLYRR